MKRHQKAVINELRREGYAVCVFSPEELGSATAPDIENALVRDGNETINTHQEPCPHD